MLGAIAGDIIGSIYEWNKTKDYNFNLFTESSHYTDDSVLSVALADSILSGVGYTIKLKEYYRRYPNAGYGGRFVAWAISDNTNPYNSFGNGSAMRVSPVGWAYNSIDEVLEKAKESAAVTHNHPEGIKGAMSVASCIFLARTGKTKDEIKHYVTETFNYDLNRSYEEIKPTYDFDVTCQGSVPEAIICFIESDSYEDAVRKAVALGGDSDTQGCITGSIAEAFYGGVPKSIKNVVYSKLDDKLLLVVDKFVDSYVKYNKESI